MYGWLLERWRGGFEQKAGNVRRGEDWTNNAGQQRRQPEERELASQPLPSSPLVNARVQLHWHRQKCRGQNRRQQHQPSLARVTPAWLVSFTCLGLCCFLPFLSAAPSSSPPPLSSPLLSSPLGMSQINVTNVRVLDNPAPFTSPFQFEITFESYPPQLQQELEWKLIYVGSADDPQYDQELDSVLVGPVQVGKNKFVFSAPAPDVAAIPVKDLMEVTVILLTALYRDKEFIRIGYYVNNDYPETETEHKREWDAYRQQLDLIAQQQAALDQQQQQQQEAAEAAAAAEGTPAAAAVAAAPVPAPLIKVPAAPPMPPVHAERLWRHILESEPRVTRFHIGWDDEVENRREAEYVMGAEDAARAVEEEQRRGTTGGEGGLVVDEGRETKRRKVEERAADEANGKEEKQVNGQHEDENDDEEDEGEDEDEQDERDLSDEEGEDEDDEVVELPNGHHAASSSTSSSSQPTPTAGIV